MRYAIATLALAALWSSPALADDGSQACYVSGDSSQVFSKDKLRHFNEDPITRQEVPRQLNSSNRAIQKCMQRHFDREGWPVQGARFLYGLRIAPTGKVAQVSVIEFQGVNDGMLMACIGRKICEWELSANPDGAEKQIVVPYVMR